MSSRKFVPYDNRRDFNGKKNYSETRYDSVPGSLAAKRGVHPQFSEPEEYGFGGAHCSSLQQATNQRFQNKKTFTLNKPRGSSTQPVSLEHGETYMNHLPLYQPLPTFRQYMNEDSDNEENVFKTNSQNSIIGNQRNTDLFVQKGNEKNQITTENNENPPDKSRQGRNQKALIGTKFRHMIGTVDHVTRWHKMTKNSELEIIFEVAGKLESIINKGTMQLLLIRSESGHVIQGVFYTIDRELPSFPVESIITATGNMIGSNKIQIYDANKISNDDFIAVQRLAFLSQRAMEDALMMEGI